MDTSLTTATKNNSEMNEQKLNEPCVNPNVGKIWTFANDTLEYVVSITEKNSSLISASKPRTAENDLDVTDISLESEPPCKEYSHDTPRASNHANLADDRKGTDVRNFSEDYSAEKIFLPDLKLSMFSKEIWTEKVLPIDTFVSPEPELVELYFDKSKMTDHFKRSEDCSTKSIDSSLPRRNDNRNKLRRNIFISTPSSARKGSASPSGQKSINFDDEIWPVCPKLILSGKEMSMSILENGHETISPERLNEKIPRTQCSPVKVSSTFGISPKSSARQYDIEDGSRSEKLIEPTHEIEGQNDFAARSEARKFLDNIYSRSTISQSDIAAVEKPHRFDNADEIFHELNPVTNLLDETKSNNSTCDGLTKASSSKQVMRRSFESSRARTLKKNPLSVSYSEPVSIILKDILSRREIDSLYEAELPAISRSESISFDNSKVKQVRFSSAKNHEINENDFATNFHTPTDDICEISRELDEISQSSGLSSRKKMREISVELDSGNRNTRSEIHAPKNHAIPFSELPATESTNVRESVTSQENVKKRKCVKVVRFKSCDKRDSSEFNKSDAKLREKFGDPNIGPRSSKVHFDFGNTSNTPDCISVDSFKQEINQSPNQIGRQIEIAPALDDAVVTLAQVEIILEANRKTVENLQQLQPNVEISRLAPPDAGKSLAKALIRCRNYMQSNAYSREATSTLNKLLTSTVQNLMQLVEKQKLVLAAQSKKRCAVPRGRRQSRKSHQENSLNAKGALAPEAFVADQMQFLISNIISLTEKIVPNFNRKESQRTHSTKNKRTILGTTPAKTYDTGFFQESKIVLEEQASRLTQPVGDQLNIQIRGHQKVDKEVETTQSPIIRSTCSKKIGSTDSTKALRKLFNELWEKRSKTLTRHCNVNDSVNNFRSLTSSHNVTINQKLPVWKPGGNNFVQPSLSAICNNQKVRPLPSASTNKKKNTISEHARDTKLHQRNKTIPGVIKETSKISGKSIIKPNNTTSIVPARERHSEMLCLDRNKAQVGVGIDETRTRKPRSKSRTRTRTPSKILRVSVTEIPLEHADDCSPITEQMIPAAQGLPLTRKASSSPKEIIQMLEELIKSSDNGNSIHNASSVQAIGRSNVDVENLIADVDPTSPLKSDVKLISASNLNLSNEQGDHKAVESPQNEKIRSKSIDEIMKESKNIAEMDDNEILIGEMEASLHDTLVKPRNLHKEFDSRSSLNAEEIFTVSKSNSEVTSNRSTEGQNIPSASNVACTAELSSEHSIGSVFSKCCQASMTSLTSHEISEELIDSQISDTGVSSCREEVEKDSNESFDTVEDDEITVDNFASQLPKGQCKSANSGTAMKKKFVNRHAKSLEMLKEILSDQGLGIHLLSQAENEMRDRCKCNSIKRGLTTRRSLQSANYASSRFPGELADENLSTTLFSKLATLSESESDIEHVEVATMTSANDSTVIAIDCSTSDKLHSHCSKGDKELLGHVVMVENATQFEITPKSDMCVGDEISYDTYAPLRSKSQENRADTSVAQCTSPATSGTSTLTHETLLVDENACKLPGTILDALRLADIRATNFYAAVNILEENMLSESTSRSKSAMNQDPNKILVHLSSADESLFAEMGSGHVRHLSKAFSKDSGVKLPKQLVESKIPKVRGKVNDVTNCSERTKNSVEESPREQVTVMNVRTVKESNERVKSNELRNACDLDAVDFGKPVVPSKPSSTEKRASSKTVDGRTFLKQQIIDPSQVLTVENKFSDTAKILERAAFVPTKCCQSSSSSQQNLIEESMTEKSIETLHFAEKQTASTVRNIVTESDPQSLNAIFDNRKSPNDVGKTRHSHGSRIKTLLEENLLRFNTEYSPIIDGKIFNIGDELAVESSDEEVMINRVFSETVTSTSCTHLDDRDTFSEVNDVLNCLLNEIEKNFDDLTMTKYKDRSICSPQNRRLKKTLRRSKSERTKTTVKYGTSSKLSEKYWNISSGMIISREHLLSLIYAVICSLVFCCLQFSVHCEV